MIYHTVTDIMAANDAAQARFIAAISNLNQAQANFRPDETRWTIAEIAEHVSIVNEGFLRIMSKLLGQAESAPNPPKADLNLGPTSLSEKGEPVEPFQAPERVHPKGGVLIEDSIARLHASLAGLGEIQSRIEAVDMSEQMFSHPVFGSMNAYRWLILLGEHEDRHRGQIERLKASAGFPA